MLNPIIQNVVDSIFPTSETPTSPNEDWEKELKYPIFETSAFWEEKFDKKFPYFSVSLKFYHWL